MVKTKNEEKETLLLKKEVEKILKREYIWNVFLGVTVVLGVIVIGLQVANVVRLYIVTGIRSIIALIGVSLCINLYLQIYKLVETVYGNMFSFKSNFTCDDYVKKRMKEITISDEK